jgi:AcrR family transcriptional regulator
MYQTVGRFTMLRVVDGRRARGAATRERLLVAARELFGERGYEATSIEAVLARSGVARGALYHHFASKAELFDAVAERVFVEIAKRTSAAAAGAEGTLEQLRAGCQAWLTMALDPAIQRLALLDPPTALGWRRWRQLDDRYSLGGLRASLRALAAEGRIPEAEQELLANMLLATLNEAALYIADAADQGAAGDVGRAAVDTLLDRLAAPAPAATPLSARTNARDGSSRKSPSRPSGPPTAC